MSDNLRIVAESESKLIATAQAIISINSKEDWAQINRTTLPKITDKVGPTCVALLQDSLSKAWYKLWRQGDRDPGSSASGLSLVTGRSWQRHKAPKLSFTPASFILIKWLTESNLLITSDKHHKRHEPLAAMKLSIGDQLLVYFAIEMLLGTEECKELVKQPFVRNSPLAWLGFPDVMALSGDECTISFGDLTTGTGAIIIELIMSQLGKRWGAIEQTKYQISDPPELIKLGAVQDHILFDFQIACEKANRRDLCIFILDAASMIINKRMPPIPVSLDPNTTLSSRLQARLAAGSLLRAIVRWQAWDSVHRGVRFIDDGYPIAQYLLARFERIGQLGGDLATSWLSELASLAPVTPIVKPETEIEAVAS